MSFLRAFALAAVLACSLSGCLQQEKVVRLRPDGSGTLEDTTVIARQVVAQMKQMSEGFGALLQGKGKADATTAPFSVLDEKKLREAADKMGDGVTFVSAKPVNTADGEGYQAIYAFTDINKLKVDQNPGDALPKTAVPMGKKLKSDPVKFQFTKGAPATLVVKMPQPKSVDLAKDRPPTPEGGGEMAAMMMQQMFKDLKISLVIEVAGRIVQSNAAFRDGSRVTLAEIDFNKVLADPQKFKALAAAQPKTVEEMKALVKGVDGIKAEVQPEVTVKFQ